MAVLVNASVYDRCCSQTVLSWTIFDVRDDSLSLSDFYQRVIRDRYDCLPEEHVHLANAILEFPSRPHACVMSLEDGKQEINLEWPNFSAKSFFLILFVN